MTYALARAALGGARAIEDYPMITVPLKEITWGELHVGSHWAFADAGFTEVSRPSLRRVVMRIDFAPAPGPTSIDEHGTNPCSRTHATAREERHG